METPSEWSKRFNAEKAQAAVEVPSQEAGSTDRPAAVEEFPSEPFQCPACGQLLAPACRVCVSCRRPIDFGAVARPQNVVLPAGTAPSAEVPPETVRFPWRILVVVMSIGILLGLISIAIWGEEKGPLVIRVLPVIAGIWVFSDALRRRIPRPLRWALGTMLLLAVIFPWYLARRSKPQASVPFVEAEAGPVTRFLLFALLVFFLIGLIFYIVQGPEPDTKRPPAPKIQKTGGYQARMDSIDPHNL